MLCSRGWRFVACWVLLGVVNGGCASTATNVRALRMYEHQHVTPALLASHLQQLTETLQLIHLLLDGVPYEPGAAWVAELPLDRARAKRARALLPGAAGEASFVLVYVTHVRSVIPPVEPATAAPASPAPLGSAGAASPTVRYASIREALGRVHPAFLRDVRDVEQQLVAALAEADRQQAELAAGADADPEQLVQLEQARAQLRGDLTRLQADLARPLGPADLQDPESARIVNDAIVVTSVALRLAVEAVALATVAGMEAVSLTVRPGQSGVGLNPDTVALLAALPESARGVAQELQASTERLDQLLSLLSALRGLDPELTAGFDYKQGLVDDIAGFGWDMVHLEAQGAGEAYFYSALATAERTTDRDGNSVDYTGRQTRLEYDVEPIVLASAGLSFKLDVPHWAEAAGLNLGYATNRVYEQGGSLGSGSLAEELGANSRFSDALDAALAIAGVEASVRLAHFAHGTVREVLIADDSFIADAPLSFEMKRIDLKYDFASGYGSSLQTLAVGLRYFDYTLPRILYELQNSTPDAETTAYTFSRETPPQSVRSRFYMAAVAARVERRVTRYVTPYGSLDVALGFGPSEYYFLRDQAGPDDPSNHDEQTSTGMAVGFEGVLGARIHFLGPQARLNAFVDAYYHAQFIGSTLNSGDDGDTIVDVGTTDLFHGPVAALGCTF